jgi:hypothetical protein
MPRINFGVDLQLLLEAEKTFNLQLRLGAGMGPTALTISPGPTEKAFSLAQVLGALSKLLDLPALQTVADLGDKDKNSFWYRFFQVSILPELTVVVAPEASSIQARLMLYTAPTRNPADYGIRFADKLPPFITIEPDITLYDLVIGYWQKDGLDLKARVKIWPQESENVLTDSTVLMPLTEEQNGKTEIVKYPFPNPSQGGQTFRVNYLGLGQRFGPPTVGLESDPIAKIFEELKNLRSNDPKTVLNALVKDYYHPDRNWFFGADIYLKGWRVQALFNDPAIYGIRITADQGAFEGFKFEILYQKLGPDLGVYYGAISIPEKYRQINLGAVALKLPSFEIWIYTNGDFKVSVGWPLGPNSIGFEIYIFIGGCAFYFAKLRSGFNPRAPEPTIYYDPIIAFGLAIKIGLGRSINAGVFRAELSLTLQGVFQGILAWEGVNPKLLNSPDADVVRNARAAVNASNAISGPPDYFWFSATVGIVGLLQGEVDLKIIKVSVSIRLSITTGLAFETEYGAVARVTAQVKAKATVKILFVKISASFSLTLTETFTLSEGPKGVASIEGPQNPNFQGIVPGALTARGKALMAVYDRRALIQDAEPLSLPVTMLLLPAALYRDGAGQSNLVGVPMIAPPKGQPGATPYDDLLIRLGSWLLRDFAPETHSWPEVLQTLGQGRDAPPDGFSDALDRFLVEEVSFVLSGIDLTVERSDDLDLLPLPMLPPLQMAVPGQDDPIVFAGKIVLDGYEAFVREYFADLSLSGLSSNPETNSRVGAMEVVETSFAQMMFADFFLMLSRDMARRLADPPVDGSDLPIGDVAQDISAIATQLAGMAARTLLGGVVLPVPAEMEQFGIDPLGVDLLGLFELSAQQFPADTSTPTNAVTFSVANPDAPLSAAISFAEGESAVTTIPVAEAPPAPNPIWRDAGLRAGVADITISQMPSINSVRRWFASRDHEAWSDLETERRLLLPPPELLGLTESGPLTLFGQKVEPDPTAPPIPDFEIYPALMIQFRIRKVALPSTGQFTDEGGPLPTELKGVYEISTTSDETRAQIRMLLDSADIGQTKLDLVRIDGDGNDDRGYRTLSSAAPENAVYLFKTNLSTLTQPENLFRPLALGMTRDDTDPDDAAIGDVAAFLRLIWQASVVNATGFYLHYGDAEQNPLPDDMFDDTGSATLTVMAAASEPRPLHTYDNALILPGDVKDTAFIAANDAGGTAIELHQPAYQAGCVAFEIDWTTAAALSIGETDQPPPFGPDTIASLYDLIQYRVHGDEQPTGFDPSLWSLPLSRAQDTKDIEQNDDGPGRYRQIVPAYKFATGAHDDIYGAVGRTPDLQFRLIDTYGNALAEAAHTVQFDALYHDPLVPLGEWPGTQATYRVARNEADQPCVFLTLDFQPDEIVRSDVHRFMALDRNGSGDDKARQQAEIARFRFALIHAQLSDPNVEADLLSTFFGPLAPLGSSDALKTALKVGAETILTDLDKFLSDGTPLQPHKTAIPVPFNPQDLTKQPDTIFAITVEAQLRRTQFVDPLAAEKLPSAAQTRWTVPLDLSVTDQNPIAKDDPEPAEVDLRSFANHLEDAFKGYDGADGLLKLTVRNGVSDFSAPETGPVLWGLKWSATAGLDVTFEAGSVAYFTLVPISTKLEGHDGVPVTIWDKDLNPVEETRAFSEIDVDAWARQFLSTMDRIMGPAVSNIIVQKGQDRFSEFATAKRLLAECLKAGVEPILVPNVRTESLSSFGGREVVEGDLGSAQDRFEQHVLTRLAAAYDSLVVMQMAADVTNSQAPGQGDAPRIFGGVEAKGTAGDASDTFSVSNTRIPIEPPADAGLRYANFLVSAVNPSRQAKLDMKLTWNVGFVEHQIASSHASGGYVPSSWLRVVDSDLASELAFDLGEVSVPIPSISYPAVPVMEAQTAIQQFAGTAETVDDFFLWSYESVIRKTEKDAKDTLFAELRLNEPILIDRLPTSFARGPGEKGDVVPLFEALARYTVAWPELEHLVEELVTKHGDLPIADQLIDVVFSLVKEVAICWAGFRGVPIPAHWQTMGVRSRRMLDKPAEVTINYAIDFENAFNEKRELIVTSDQTDIWPRINDQDGKPGADEHTRIYPYDGETDKLALRWWDFSALGQQTARLTTWLKRNSNLSEGGDLTVNPNLIYATPASTYANPVIPRLRIDEFKNDEDAPDLATTLLKTLNLVLGVASVLKNKRAAKIETRYEYSLISDPRASKSSVKGRASVLLTDGVEIDLAEVSEEEDPIKVIADAIAADIEIWHAKAAMPTRSAELVQSLVLFAVIQDVHQPILSIDRILYDVPKDWWT